jgi:hypothetical protein
MTIIIKNRLSLASLNQEDLYEDDNGKWVVTNRTVYVDNSKYSQLIPFFKSANSRKDSIFYTLSSPRQN